MTSERAHQLGVSSQAEVQRHLGDKIRTHRDPTISAYRAPTTASRSAVRSPPRVPSPTWHYEEFRSCLTPRARRGLGALLSSSSATITPAPPSSCDHSISPNPNHPRKTLMTGFTRPIRSLRHFRAPQPLVVRAWARLSLMWEKRRGARQSLRGRTSSYKTSREVFRRGEP